ncbi:peptidylprolyl isomerase [Halalkalibacter kiskunsagensis]|uniref:Peptidyl-prolyl cis-trans isomerase n=1 Tax=Halalkalibacter kiskunsagensis TaxID=1548599 RepID=A0ABV6K941_9BACI
MSRLGLTQRAYFVVLAALLLMLAGCGTQPDEEQAEDQLTEETEQSEQSGEQSDYSSMVEENPIVTITMESGDEIVLELYPDIAPNTVANFISLVEEGFYDGLLFHRVIPGFMIQGGDPVGDGSGGPGYEIEGEFDANGFENPLKHERGVLSMARTNDPNSAGSQFFIMVEESTQLDGQYAGFGKAIEGMETVDDIVHADRDHRDKPEEDQRIQSVTVDTKGYDYPEPEKR